MINCRYLITIDYYDLYVCPDNYYAVNNITKEKILLPECWNISEAKKELKNIINKEV